MSKTKDFLNDFSKRILKLVTQSIPLFSPYHDNVIIMNIEQVRRYTCRS